MKNLIVALFSLFFAVTSQAQEQTVRFAVWGGNENINNWIDTYVTDQLKSRYNINLQRVPLSDTQDAVQKLVRDKRLGRDQGSIDLLWLNGENFKVMKENGLTWKSFLKDLENTKYLNLEDPTIMNDFGIFHDGHEMPWGSAQLVFMYDSAKVLSPPKTVSQLTQWIKDNPGRFTYSAPPDFTGSAFIRQSLLNLMGRQPYDQMINNISAADLKNELRRLWDWLSEVEPYLYRQGEYYPESVSKLHQLFSDGTIWITMDYYPTTAQRMMDKGFFPQTTKTFVFDEGTLANTHYVTIPFNAPNKTGAVKVSDFLLSVESQISKLNPVNWGDFSVLDLSRMSEQNAKIFKSVDLGDATLPIETLNNAKVQEIPAQFIPMIEEEWKNNITRK